MESLRYAKQALGSLRSCKNLVTGYVGGSHALGCVDEFSDLDIGLIWKHPPAVGLRAEIIGRLGTPVSAVSPWVVPRRATGNEDSLFGVGTKVDLCHHTLDTVNSWIAAVMNEYDVDVQKQILISNLQRGLVFLGEDEYSRIRRSIAVYPVELGRRCCQLELFGLARANGFAMASRREYTAFSRVLANEQDRLFRILLALNKTFNPGTKHLMWQLTQLKVVPNELHKRFAAIEQTSAVESWSIVQQCVYEVLDLVDREKWKLDTESVRIRLRDYGA